MKTQNLSEKVGLEATAEIKYSKCKVDLKQEGAITSLTPGNTHLTTSASLLRTPKFLNKSRNSRIMGSQTHIGAKRRPSKKYSKDMEVIKVIKNPDKSKKDSIFLMYQKYPRMTKTGSMGYASKGPTALSPKISKNVKSSGISGMDKYMLKVNPSKISDSRGDRKMTNYPHSLGSAEGSRSKEDLRYVPVENISLFDETNIPLSARNPQNVGGLSSHKVSNASNFISQIRFFRYFKIIKLFKVWSGYTRRQKYLRKRVELAQNLPWGKQFFIPFISGAIEPLNEIRYCSPLIEVKSKNIYTKKNDGHKGFLVQ